MCPALLTLLMLCYVKMQYNTRLGSYVYMCSLEFAIWISFIVISFKIFNFPGYILNFPRFQSRKNSTRIIKELCTYVFSWVCRLKQFD